MKKKLKMSMGSFEKPKTLEEFTGSKDTHRLTIDLPEDLHAKFKSVVSLIKPRTTMTKVTIELIKEYLDMK